jgi:eukaryotic-like serine/threonine-protein kinase
MDGDERHRQARGATRFELLSKLGEGGMGVVYEARDRERNMRVALKTLRHLDAASLYQFKREFRALSDLSHPNIVGLYELVSEGDDWYLSMELVEGEDIVAYMRGHRDGGEPAVISKAALRTPGSVPPHGSRAAPDMPAVTIDTRVVKPAPRSADSDQDSVRFTPSLPEKPTPIDEVVDLERLMNALSQLAQALYALHSQNMVHRDLKPGNVRVTPEGRVVLMDFGIVAEILNERRKRNNEPPVGTPAYMAPEQATEAPPSAAADWYAFGVILYQGLTGKLPFRGPGMQLIEAKHKHDPVAPSAYTEGIPEDLAALCMELLSRDPEARPHGYSVLTRLGVAAESISRLLSEVTFVGPSEFVGRSQLLQDLDDAYRQATAGQCVLVLVEGASGMGKTTLLRRFVHGLQATEVGAAAPLILSGRCHERESLSYKAFDGVIDQLSRELLELPEHIVAAVLPRDMDLVTRLFPVLRRVPGVPAAARKSRGNAGDLRARAVEALRTLLANLTAWRPVVMRIEDLQWADGDSLELLLDLLQAPAPARLLLLASLRSDTTASSAFGAVIRPDTMLGDVIDLLAEQVMVQRIEVAPLSRTEQDLMVAKLMGERNLPATIDPAFWAEAEGNPLLLIELARYAAEAPQDLARITRPKLEQVIAQRIARLPRGARALLEIVAVAGEPTPLSLLAEAAGLSDDDRERASATLRVAKLARVAVPGHEPWLSAQHDKIRETVVATLPVADRRAMHRRLAQALERWDSASVPSLAHHWLGAGDREQARSYLVASARAAAGKLAFDRAADFYRVVAELLDDAPDFEHLAVLRPLGRALAQAGRFHEAADVYAEAARRASGDEVLELERLGADNLLRCGRIDEGKARLQSVLGSLGIRLARSQRGKLMSLVMQRAKLSLRGIKYTAREESEVPARDLGRLDTLYAAATALGMIDHLLGSVVQARHLRLALRTGDERRVCRALAAEVIYLGALGARHERRASEVGSEVMLLARRLDDPLLVGLAHFGAGVVAFFAQRMRMADESLTQALAALEGVAGAEWERMTIRFFSSMALINLGEWNRVTQVLERWIERAERHRDVYAMNLFKAEPSTWRWLIRDRPGDAHRSIDASLEGWPPGSHYVAHHQASVSRALVHLYEGEGEAAARVLDLAWSQMGGLLLDSMAQPMSEVLTYRARAALMIGDRATVEKCATRLARLDLCTAPALAQLLEAPLRLREGDEKAAERLLSAALEGFTAHHAAHMSAACRYRLGELIGGAQGAELRASAMAWMKEQNVASPERMLALLTWSEPAPG